MLTPTIVSVIAKLTIWKFFMEWRFVRFVTKIIMANKFRIIITEESAIKITLNITGDVAFLLEVVTDVLSNTDTLMSSILVYLSN
jgi:hypothetical protein